MRPETRVLRWREIACTTLALFEGDLDAILRGSYTLAKKALQQFPAIGDPGPEKILKFCGAAPGLPLESNGLRVLTRVGYGHKQRNYAAPTGRSRRLFNLSLQPRTAVNLRQSRWFRAPWPSRPRARCHRPALPGPHPAAHPTRK